MKTIKVNIPISENTSGIYCNMLDEDGDCRFMIRCCKLCKCLLYNTRQSSVSNKMQEMQNGE